MGSLAQPEPLDDGELSSGPNMWLESPGLYGKIVRFLKSLHVIY